MSSDLIGLYQVVLRELKDCFFETCKHQIASDTIARSNLEIRGIQFPSSPSGRTCNLCKSQTQQSKFVSWPTLTHSLMLEWVYCTSVECQKHTPQLKLTNRGDPSVNRLSRPTRSLYMLTARMNDNLFSVERIYTNYIDTKWERLVDDACDKHIPPELIHLICLFDPFHFAIK
jgi:hypothetical protein